MGSSRIPESRNYWLDLGLFYCSKRETSRARLRAYFLRKIKEYRIPPEDAPTQVSWFDSVLDELEEKKILDDSRYAGILQRDYLRRGKGKRYIEQKMKERGLTAKIPDLDFDLDSELERACELASKTLNRSSIKKIEDPYAIKTKLLQKLVSSGFEFDLAKKAVELVLRSK